MALAAAPTVTQTPATPTQAAAAAIPFRRASRKKADFAFSAPASPVTLGAAPVTLSPIAIPADGFLSYIELEVTITAATNAAAVAFTGDAPFNVLSQVYLSNSAGSEILVPITGYQLYLINKYGLVGFDAPWSDPRSYNDTLTVSGAGSTGGSASFTLRVPLEIDPATGFCAIPNLASNRSYMLNLQLAALGTVYTTAPTNAPTVSIRGVAYYWTQPLAQTPSQTPVPQEQAPLGDGSISAWRYEPIVINAGDKILKSNNVGNVIRTIIFTLRNGSGARDDADFPATSQILYNGDPIYNQLTPRQWRRIMSQVYGYGQQTAAGGGLPAQDQAGGQDTGVYVWSDMLAETGHCRASAPRDQYLTTVQEANLSYHGTSFGAGAATFEVLSNLISPVSASALYAHV